MQVENNKQVRYPEILLTVCGQDSKYHGNYRSHLVGIGDRRDQQGTVGPYSNFEELHDQARFDVLESADFVLDGLVQVFL